MDSISTERRSAIMRRVKSKDTSAEWIVRRATHAMGYRYRLHQKDLPGKPDLVFSTRKKAIFVHGCFWHSHYGCKRARVPESNHQYWASKIARNMERDHMNLQSLRETGWQSLVIWECELRNASELKARIKEFLDG